MKRMELSPNVSSPLMGEDKGEGEYAIALVETHP
jgi:hypothetical protein